MLTHKSLLPILLVLLFISSPCSPTILEQLQALDYPNTTWDSVESLLNTGQMDGFFMWKEILPVFDWLGTKFPNLISKPFTIGKTYQENDIIAYAITRTDHEEDFKASKKPAVLFTGQHHAREVITLNMQVYLTLQLLHQYLYVQDPETQRRVNETVTWFIPVVNLDSVRVINENYEANQRILAIRKNQHVYSSECTNYGDEVGVDLNRNYDYAFGYDNQGSSGDECADIYRGPAPFSEPETRAVRDFVVARLNIVLAINLHAFGDLWIIPYNYANNIDNNKLTTNSTAYQVYSEIRKECLTTSNADMGNGYQTVNYPANGESSDWMLGARNIIALSPEIGNNLLSSHSFHPQQDDIIPILRDTANSLANIMKKTLPDIQTHFIKEIEEDRIQTLLRRPRNKEEGARTQVIQLFNKGLSASPEFSLELEATETSSIEVFYAIFNESFFLNSIVNQTTEIVDSSHYANYTVLPENITYATKLSKRSNEARVTYTDRLRIPGRSFMQIFLKSNEGNIEPIDGKLVLKGVGTALMSVRIDPTQGAISLAERLKIELSSASVLVLGLLTLAVLGIMGIITASVWRRWSRDGEEVVEDELDLCRSREMEEKAGDLVLNSL